MIDIKKFFLSQEVKPESGAGMLEVLLAMGIVAIATPFLYKQISDTNQIIRNMAIANRIISVKEPALNFVRINQETWPKEVQIKLSEEELDSISDFPVAAFIDKYLVKGATITDIYLAFDLSESELKTNMVAKQIGESAAVVGTDGIAYASSWAVTAPDFKPGFLIYRISKDAEGEDKSKYLHRATTGQDELNKMFRDLNMGGNSVFNVGGLYAKAAQVKTGQVRFLETENLVTDDLYFSSGANVDGENVYIKDLRVTGDMSGFRNIYADKLNGSSYTTKGKVIADRVNVVNSINVSNEFELKSDTLRTISGFLGISAHTVETSYLNTEEMIFLDNFGLTISGELLMSTTPPLKIGSWIFPSLNPPSFAAIQLQRADIPEMPVKEEFEPLLNDSWKEIKPKEVQ